MFLENIQVFLPRFLDAFLITLPLSAISLVLASIVGIIVGLITTSRGNNPILMLGRGLAKLYIELIRGTPMIVQIFIIYFGIGQVFSPMGFRWNNIGGVFTAGVVVLTLNAGAYMAEIVRAGIEAVDKGQIEAARSLGLTYGTTMIQIVLPQAIRTMLPSIINQFIITIKDSSLLSVVGLAELTNVTKQIASNWSSLTMALYCFLALWYLMICFTLSRLAKYLERKMSYGR